LWTLVPELRRPTDSHDRGAADEPHTMKGYGINAVPLHTFV